MEVKRPVVWVLVIVAWFLSAASHADEVRAPRKKGARGEKTPGGVLQATASLNTPDVQEDFVSLCTDSKGTPWVAYIEYDGTADTIQLAELSSQGFVKRGEVSRPSTASRASNLYQPCLACDGSGTIWCVWSQLEDGQWDLYGRRVTDGKLSREITTIVASPGNDVFPDAKTDRKGRLWVTWQSFNGGNAEIFAKHFDPKQNAWSEPIQVTKNAAGDWEPRLAFGNSDEALIVFDSYRDGNFDVYLARVSPSGDVELEAVAGSDRYEARAEAAVSPDGRTLWVAYEDGISRWGKDLGSEWRRLGSGLHFDRHLYLVKIDLTTGEFRRVADVTPLIPRLVATLGQPTSASVCLPELITDRQGNPWLFYRYAESFWQVAVTKYDVEQDRWTQPQQIAQSGYCQDRRSAVALAPDGSIYVACSTDRRTGKDQLVSGVTLARIDPDEPRAFADPSAFAKQKQAAPAFIPVNNTRERPRSDRHRWKFDGEEYTLCWGDLHRHTDFSNCRTTDDGCIVEQFRYAYDAAGLDYLATTDHSDQGQGYSDYEWWQNQKLADMFHSPGFFVSLYGYEREQRGPYGHRNVFFIDRDGPMIYINRERFAKSRWAQRLSLPEQAGARKGEIPPPQLWQLLRESGMRAIAIAHTPAGNDWTLFDQVDTGVEPVMEIYQGSRQSYEGAGTPQPAVAKQDAKQNSKTGSKNKGRGTYQDALAQGHKLGVIASSDHRSTNISYGGVYLKTFNRKGVFDAINLRHTIAATDKIVMMLSCNGHMLGEVFRTTEKPALKLSIGGTAPLRAVTVVRNEKVVYRFTPEKSSIYEGTFNDADPVLGENRYYLRVEQVDGNMGWTSPVWVTYATE